MSGVLVSAKDLQFNKAQEHITVELDAELEGGLFSSIPATVGRRFETPLGGVIDASRAPGSLDFRANVEFTSILLAPSPNMQAAFASDHVERFNASVGTIVVNPQNVHRFLRWESCKRNVAVAFSPQAYAELATADLEGADWELRPPRFDHVDLDALRIARAMSTELARSPVNALYLESLITLMGVHLIRTYSSVKPHAPQVPRMRLSPATAKRIIEYTREHLSRRISVADLAKQAGLSQSHFLRAVTQTFGAGPHQYLLNLRLQEAEILLMKTSSPISEIAYETGFSSQSHLTSAMRRYKQITPARLRNSM